MMNLKIILSSDIVKKIGSLSILSAIAYLLMFLFETLIAKKFGPESYGQYQYVMGVATVLSALCALGLPQYTARESKKNLIRKKEISNLSIAIFCPVVMLIPAMVMFLFFNYYIVIITYFMSVKLFYRRAFQGVGKLSYGIVIDEFFYSIILIISISVIGGNNPALCQIISLFITVLMFFLFLFKLYKWDDFKVAIFFTSFNRLYQYVKSGFNFIPFVISQYGVRKIDSVIILPILGSSALGQYSAAMKVSGMVIFASLIANSVVGDKLSHLYYQRKIERLNALFYKTLAVSTILGFIICGFLFVYSKEFIVFFFGEQFLSASRLLDVILIGQFISIASGPCLQFFSLTDEYNYLMRASIFFLFYSVAFFCFFTSAWGIQGASYAFVISNLIFRVQILVRARVVLKNVKK